jgi:hypothetical protein
MAVTPGRRYSPARREGSGALPEPAPLASPFTACAPFFLAGTVNGQERHSTQAPDNAGQKEKRMDKPKIYLETTIFSFYYEERTAPLYLEHKALVRRIFDLIKAGEFEAYTSPYVIREISNETNPEKREKMKALSSACGAVMLPITKEVERLAGLYVQEGAVSPAWKTDAAHIAVTSVNGLDFIVSLNFTHIVRPWTIERVRRVNRRENYQGIGIYKPAEVLEIYEDSTGIHE